MLLSPQIHTLLVSQGTSAEDELRRKPCFKGGCHHLVDWAHRKGAQRDDRQLAEHWPVPGLESAMLPISVMVHTRNSCIWGTKTVEHRHLDPTRNPKRKSSSSYSVFILVLTSNSDFLFNCLRGFCIFLTCDFDGSADDFALNNLDSGGLEH